MVNIKTLKSRISAKYPSESISPILKDAPDHGSPLDYEVRLRKIECEQQIEKIKQEMRDNFSKERRWWIASVFALLVVAFTLFGYLLHYV